MTIRIASLIPSGTELVAALGMAHSLVGRSHCCDYPAHVADLPVLSRPKVDPERPGDEIDEAVREIISSGESLYDILLEPLRAAAPDVVITQDHCDVCAVTQSDVEEAVACAGLGKAEVCSLHPHDLPSVFSDVATVAAALGVPERGRALIDQMRAGLEDVEERVSDRRPVSVAMVEWLYPPMIAGGWMPEIARIAGLEPVIVRDSSHFVQTDWGGVADARPDAVVLLPCGFTVGRTLKELDGRFPDELAGAPPPRGVWVVDGDALFNRPGPRLVESAALLQAIFHPHMDDALRPFEGMVQQLDVPVSVV